MMEEFAEPMVVLLLFCMLLVALLRVGLFRLFAESCLKPLAGPFIRFVLAFGQFVSMLGCAAGVLYPLLVLWMMASTTGKRWTVQGVVIIFVGGFVGFCYSAAMFVVFTRIGRIGAGLPHYLNCLCLRSYIAEYQ